MEGRVTISESEVMDAIRTALARAADGPDDAFTTSELTEQTGLGESTIRRALKQLLRSGNATCMTVKRVAMDGRLCRVPGYRIKTAA